MMNEFDPPQLAMDESERLSLCEALDRIINKGAVVIGEVTISVADIDLVHLSLQLVLQSIDSAIRRQNTQSPEFGGRA